MEPEQTGRRIAHARRLRAARHYVHRRLQLDADVVGPRLALTQCHDGLGYANHDGSQRRGHWKVDQGKRRQIDAYVAFGRQLTVIDPRNVKAIEADLGAQARRQMSSSTVLSGSSE